MSSDDVNLVPDVSSGILTILDEHNTEFGTYLDCSG